MVARMPCWYLLVPRIMSFSTWPDTGRQNRIPMVALMDFGSESLSGRWVASATMMPSARPRLVMPTHKGSASLPYSG
jgi:hypothetical protein